MQETRCDLFDRFGLYSVKKSKHHWSFGSSVRDRDQKPRGHKLLSLENFLACEHKLGKLYQVILYSVDIPRTVC